MADYLESEAESEWWQLQQRKQNLLKLLGDMREFQLDKVMANPDDATTMRLVKDEDIERKNAIDEMKYSVKLNIHKKFVGNSWLKSAQTPEELRDVHTHFLLYYSSDLPEMQKVQRAKEKKERDIEKKTPSKLRTRVLLGLLAAILVVSTLCGLLISNLNWTSGPVEPPDPTLPMKPSASCLHWFKRAAVCTDAPTCSEIGRKILAQNGSAVDAAIAAIFCNGILNHQSNGLGGGFFMIVFIKEQKRAYTVNARETAPLAATQDMFHGNTAKASKGPLAVGVPGELRGMWAAYQRWGRLPWERLVLPTLEFCKYGIQLTQFMHDNLDPQTINGDPLLQKQYIDPSTEEFYKVGTIVKPNKALCKTLRTIAERGGDELYNGSLSRDFVRDLTRVGSIITAEDLRNYHAKITDAMEVPLAGGDRLHAPPPPSSGLILANILNILAGYGFGPHSINTTEDKILTYHRIIEAFKFAYATRTKLGDVDFLDLDELIHNVTQPEYGAMIRGRINDTMTSNNAATYGADLYSPPDAGTAHFSIIADNGDAVSVTSTINYYFGARFTTKKTGIVMNNVMDDFSSPGIVNYFGLAPSPANFIAPGKRPLSSMSPVIISDAGGNARLVVGAAGGTKITTAIALVAIRKLWFQQSIKEAVDESRIHHQIHPMQVDYEYGVIDDIVQGLKAKGHTMVRYNGRGSIVCALFRNETGIYANADYRKRGDVSGD